MRTLVQRYPLTAFFILAYLFSWGGVAAVVGPANIVGDGEAATTLLPWVFAVQVAGPPVAALVLTALIDGRPGIETLFRRMVAWRAPWPCYAIALLAAPLTALAVLLAFSLGEARYLPGILSGGDVIGLLGLGLAVGLVAGGLEEIGWTGFAQARAPAGWSVLWTGLVIGGLHGAWHFLAGFWGDAARFGGLYLPHFVVFWVGGLVALRVIIVWLFRRTLSLPVAQVAHASYTGGLLILWPAATAIDDVRWTAVFALMLWLVALAIVLRGRNG